MQLIAFTVNENADVMSFSVHRAKTPERKLGSWEIRVSKVED